MSVDVYIECNECKDVIHLEDDTFCWDCYQKLKDIITENEKEITKLKNILKERDDFFDGKL